MIKDIKLWELYPHIWATESAYMSWLRGGIRRYLWSKNPVKLEFIKQNRVKIPNPNPRGKVKEVWGGVCALTGKTYPIGDMEVDHKEGNHSLKTLDDLEINYLVAGKEFKFRGWTFIGDTLFSEFNLPDYDNEFLINNAKYYLSDFHYIGYNSTSLVTPQDYISEFYKQYAWINSFRNKENIFVITHFVPSVQLIHEQYEQSPLNPYFVNNLNLKGFSHWACGHSHQTIRNIVDGCNVYMNAYGYTNNIEWECPEFNTNYIIEI